MLGKGQGSTRQFDWEDFNIPLPIPTKNNQESGLAQAYLVSFLEMAFSPGSTITPLLSKSKIQVVPVSLAKDGFTLKPGFKVDQNTMSILGGKQVYSADYVKNNPPLLHESFKDKFVKEVQIMGITTLDNKAALIIGNDFTGLSGDGDSTLQCHVKRIQELQQRLNCLRENPDAIVKEECHTTVCGECFSMADVCSTCRQVEHVHWAPVLRCCDRCIRNDLQCSKLACFNLDTDCQSMFKAALERLGNEQKQGKLDKQLALSAPNPDVVHAGKNIHRSHCNWFLFVDKARFSIAVLRAARVYSSLSKDLSAVITNMALRGRDRMDTSYVAECNSKAVGDIIQRMKYLGHTLVPRMFWKEYGHNKEGVLEHPIAVCTGSFGSMFLADFTAATSVKA